MARGTYISKPQNEELEKVNVTAYLEKKIGEGFDYTSYKDDGKYIYAELDYGDDEIITVVVSRRVGDKGNYRIVSEG